MHMKKGLFLGLIAAVVMLASCNKTLQKPDEITVNPSPLVLKGGKVDAAITGTFPEKKFAKKGVLTVTPVLKYAGKDKCADLKPLAKTGLSRMREKRYETEMASRGITIHHNDSLYSAHSFDVQCRKNDSSHRIAIMLYRLIRMEKQYDLVRHQSKETLIKAPPRSGGARKHCKTNSISRMLSR